jgi:ferredoxin-NADP reductase
LSNGSMPLGTLITVRQAGAGQITFVASGTGTPPTLNIPADRAAKTRAQGSVVMAHLVDTSGGGTWDLAGDMEAT